MNRPFTATLVAFLDQTLDAVLACDDARRFVYVNRAAEQLFGESAGHIVGRRIDDALVAPPGLTVQDLWAQFIRDQRFRGRLTLNRRDGARRDVEVTATANWQHGLHVGFCRDVTERTLAERRLTMQYEVAQALTESASLAEAAPRLLGAIAFTLDAGFAALWIVDRQADALKVAGVWAGDVAAGLGQQPDDLALDRGAGLPGQAWKTGRMAYVRDLAAACPDSPLVPAALAAGLSSAVALPVFGSYGVIGVAEFFGASLAEPDPWHLDIMTAACNQLSQFLERRRSESQFLVMGRVGWHLPVGLVVWQLEVPGDPSSFRLVAVNPAARGFTGLIDWREGMSIADISPGVITPEFTALMLRVIETGMPHDIPEAPGTASSVPDRLFTVRIVPLTDRTAGVLFEDVTERRRLERELLQYTGNLEAEINARIARIRELEVERARAEKLAAAGRLAARVAHEIINPLASIKNAFALVKEGVRPDFPHAHYVPRIEREIGRIARIVGQMRELYRPVTEPVVECDVVALVNDLAALLDMDASERGLGLRIHAAQRPLTGKVQQDGLRQILQNLIRNAFDASRPGGAVDVVIEAEGRTFSFTVQDEGAGVPAEVAEHLFEPFFTTKAASDGSGLGLGLSIAQSLATGMHGELRLVPGRSSGNGAAFRLTIPRDASRILS